MDEFGVDEDGVTVRPDAATRPQVRAVIVRALEAIGGDEPPFGCEHLVSGADLCRIVCGDHPRLGVQCPDCYRTHFARHGDLPACSGCGGEAARPVWQEFTDRELMLLADPIGMVAVLRPAVVTVAMVLCDECCP